MILKEIIKNLKNKAVIVAVIVISLFIVVCYAIQPKKEDNSIILKKHSRRSFPLFLVIGE